MTKQQRTDMWSWASHNVAIILTVLGVGIALYTRLVIVEQKLDYEIQATREHFISLKEDHNGYARRGSETEERITVIEAYLGIR